MAPRELTDPEECVVCKRRIIDVLKYGPLLEDRGIILHYYCLLFSNDIEQYGADWDGIFGFLHRDIIQMLKSTKKNICCYCSGSQANIKCSKLNCTAVFHLPCGVENGSIHQFMGRFNSFCFTHRPRQRIRRKIQLQAREEPPTCLICLEFVDCHNINDVIWASCCGSTWYHMDCLRAFALSSGYLFKCVGCRNRVKFRNLVRRLGIYIPNRDASWETTPGAFQELYTRRKICDADDCKCPFGRAHDDGDWGVVICCLCGSQGIHVRCGGLVDEEWMCHVCEDVK